PSCVYSGFRTPPGIRNTGSWGRNTGSQERNTRPRRRNTRPWGCNTRLLGCSRPYPVAMLDLLLRDVRALTLDPSHPRAHTIGVFGGRIVGVDDEVEGMRARHVVDGGGAVVTPGFSDAHNHMVWYGLSLAEMDLSTISSPDALYDAVAAEAATLPADGWVIGSGYDDFALGGHPDRAALDRAGGGRPVWLKHRSAHMATVSTRILELTGVLDGSATVPEGGVVERGADGAPTGLL